MQLTKNIRMPLRSRAVAFVRRLMPPAFAAAILSFVLHPGLCFAQQGNEKTFASPGDAALALYNAAKANDSKALESIFGSGAHDILHTGDAVADKNMASDFLRRYDQMLRVVIEPDQTATLYIGAENWPVPISIVKNSSGAWYFDTETGKKEIFIAASARMRMMPSIPCTPLSRRSTTTLLNRATVTRPNITPQDS